MPSKLIDRSKAKNRGIMPSKLIGPPITRWKEKTKQKHHYLMYQTKHHSHQLIIIILILCHHIMTLSINRITHTVTSQELIFTCSTQYVSIVITCSTLYNNLMENPIKSTFISQHIILLRHIVKSKSTY